MAEEGKDIVKELGGDGHPREVLWNLFPNFHISKRDDQEIYDFKWIKGSHERKYDTNGLVDLIAKNFESGKVQHSTFEGDDDFWVIDPAGDLKNLLDARIADQEKEFLKVLENFTVEKDKAAPNRYAIKLNSDAKPQANELWSQLSTGILLRYNDAAETSYDQSQQARMGILHVRTTYQPLVEFMDQRIATQEHDKS